MVVANYTTKKNPYRVLGVYVGSSSAQEASNLSRIKAFAKVEQTATFNMRGDALLGAIERTENMAAEAAQVLSLPRDRILHALFWWTDVEAEWGDALNLAVSSLMENDMVATLDGYNRLIYNEENRTAFVSAATHNIAKMDEAQLADMLIDALQRYCDFNVSHALINQHLDCNNPLSLKLIKVAYVDKLMANIVHYDNINYGIDFNLEFKHMREAESLMEYIETVANCIGRDNVCYMELAENLAKAVYTKADAVCEHTYHWTMDGRRQLKNGNVIREELYSTRSHVSIRSNLTLLKKVDNYTKDVIERLKLSEVSQQMLYADENLYRTHYESHKREMEEAYRLAEVGSITQIIVYVILYGILLSIVICC